MSLTENAVTIAIVRTRLHRILGAVAQLRVRFGDNEAFDEIERDASNALQELTERPQKTE